MINGVTLYNLRDYCQNLTDLERTLKIMKANGITSLQISGIGKMDMMSVAELVKKYNIDVPVTHTPFDRLLNDTEKVIAEHKALGCDCIGIGAMPEEYRGTKKGVGEFIEKMKTIGEKMYENGCHLCYHNHNFDSFEVEGGACNLDRFLSELDENTLWFIPDVAWLTIGGENPTDRLEQMRGRVKTMHFKDFVWDENTEEKNNFKFVELGKGETELERCYKKAEELGIKYAIFEQDNNWEKDAIWSSIESYEYLENVKANLNK